MLTILIFFADGISKKLVLTLTLEVPPNLIGVVTLPCEMSDIALKPAVTMINCMVNVIEPDMWLPNSPN